MLQVQILGSGGYTRTPMPACACQICSKARKDVIYRRLSTCFYVSGANLLIDTPEDIFEALNYSSVHQVDSVFYSHWHPDHMAGWRVLESLYFVQRKPIDVFLTCKEDLFKYSGFSYLEQKKYINIYFLNHLDVIARPTHILVTPICFSDLPCFAFHIQNSTGSCLMIPDHSKAFLEYMKKHPMALSTQVLCMNMGSREKSTQITSIDDNLQMKDLLHVQSAHLAHIEAHEFCDEDDMRQFEKEMRSMGIFLTRDGEKISI